MIIILDRMMIAILLYTVLAASCQTTILFKDVGLLLEELQDTVVTTGYTTREVLLFDEFSGPPTADNGKWSNAAHEKLYSMSTMFYNYITTKLDDNGYIYNADHGSEEHSTDEDIYYSDECKCAQNQCDCLVPATNTIQLIANKPFSGKVHLTYRSPYGDEALIKMDRQMDGMQIGMKMTTNVGIWTADLTTGSYGTQTNVTVKNSIVSVDFDVDNNNKLFLT